MNPSILDSIRHRLRGEIQEKREKTERNCPLNAEITPKKESEKSTAKKAN